MNFTATSDDEIERVLERYRDLLAALDADDSGRQFADHRAYLAGSIAKLEGEREP